MFLFQYIKNPKTVGAIAPSSKYLADKMVDEIDFSKAKCIVEYGPGTGIFTEKILARINSDATVVLIEINNEFYLNLRKLYGHKKNIIIINGSAENIDKVLKKHSINHIDYVISGLPFTSLPKEVSNCILSKTSSLLRNKGEFITFQYSLFKLNLFKEYFNKVNYRKVVRNLPPAYVLKCKAIDL